MKGIIFDLDGVICSTDRFHFDAWRTVMTRVGITIGEDVNSRIRGVSRMEGLNRILGDRVSEFSQEQKEELAREKNELYITLLDGMSEYIASGNMTDYQDHYYPSEMAVDAILQTYVIDQDKEAFLERFDSDWLRYNRDIIRTVEQYEEEHGNAE